MKWAKIGADGYQAGAGAGSEIWWSVRPDV